MPDASRKIDVRRLKVGDLLIQIYIYIIYSQDTVIDNIIAILYECEMCALCTTRSSIPCSRSVVISVPVTQQRRHLERIQCV